MLIVVDSTCGQLQPAPARVGRFRLALVALGVPIWKWDRARSPDPDSSPESMGIQSLCEVWNTFLPEILQS